MQEILRWCLYALLFYTIKIVSFSASTWISHIAAYHILEGLRLRLTDRFLKAPLGDVEGHSIGEIKSIMVEKIENMEPPIAHMIPEGSGHLLLPVISFIAFAYAGLENCTGFPCNRSIVLVFMTLTMIISGKSFTQYDESNAHMNSTIVEYIEGIEVIKAFGRAGTSYEKYAKAILDYKKFVVKWLSSTWITMKMTFALFPSTLLGTLPVGLYLTMHGQLIISQLVLWQSCCPCPW
ncbi:MAG: ABC transporter transmembrane domain-containing protein [Blautia massiliensis (ex Durand et al. 2017)]